MFYYYNFGTYLSYQIAGSLSLIGTACVLIMFWKLKKQRTLPSRFVAMLQFNYFIYNLNELIYLFVAPHLDLQRDEWHYCKMNAYINNYFA